MKVGKWNEAEDEKIMINGGEVESVDALCYLGSVVAADSSYDREIKVRIGRGKLLLEGMTESGRKTDAELGDGLESTPTLD